MKSVTNSAHRIRVVLAAFGLAAMFGIGWAFSSQVDFVFEVRRSSPLGNASGDAYQPRYRREAGRQLVMVYVGSQSCGASNHESLPAAVEAIKLRLANYAATHELSFKAEGVALDWSPERGLDHLGRFGLFDELSAGYNWGSSSALKYLWADGQVDPVTPQILVYEREFIAPRDTTDILLYEERNRRRLAVASGPREIMDWADAGAISPGGSALIGAASEGLPLDDSEKNQGGK